MIRTLPLLALLCAGLAAAAPASTPSEPGKPGAEERARIEGLMRRAVDAARKEAEAARSAPALDPDDRRDAQTHFAQILYYADGCEAAAGFARDRPEILGASLKRLVAGALRHSDRGCAVALVPLMLERWQDPSYVPRGRIGLRYYGGAILDSAGKADGRRIRRDAEAQLMAPGDNETRWDARWDALDAYAETPAFGNYLEYLADRMVAEPRSYSDSKRNGIFAIFAHFDRCDLVERVSKTGPGSCDRPKADSKLVYGEPSPSLVASTRVMASWLGVEQPTLDEKGLQTALTAPAPWGRVSKLLVFVSYCRWVLDGRGGPGGT